MPPARSFCWRDPGGIKLSHGNHRLAAFQQEGHADYVAFARPPPFDLAGGRQALARDAPVMDVRRSGLYRRYELMVAYRLERRGTTVDGLLAGRIDPAATLAALRADPDLSSDPSR